MVTLFGIMEVGARALSSQQAGLNVTGNNIANANTEGYSRQRVNFAPTDPLQITPGALPTGVRVDFIERIRDEFLDYQTRSAITDQGYYNEYSDILDELQVVIQDSLTSVNNDNSLDEYGLNSLMSGFYDAFHELSINPESLAVRAAVREAAISLARGFNEIDSGLQNIKETLNAEIDTAITEMNAIMERIGALNKEIVASEANPVNNANDLRDLRDSLLGELAEYAPITVTEQPNGQMDVRIFGTGVVVGIRVAKFEAITDPEDPTGSYQIVNSIERSRILTNDFETGKLGALIDARNNLVPGLVGEMDTLAQTFINEVNQIHANSAGLDAMTSLSSTLDISDPLSSFDGLKLDVPLQAGSFEIRVVDANNVVQNRYTVNFDPSVDSLSSLAAAIDAVDGVAGPGGGSISATVDADNRLQITANGSFKFGVANDTSHVISSIGMNNFFDGNDAGTMSISAYIADTEEGLRRIAASSSGAPGDNGGALAIADLQYELVADGDVSTLGDAYSRIVTELGSQAKRNAIELNSSTITLKTLESRQDSITGVSLDEEAINLIRYQQAYSAAARFITTVDTLMDRVINGLGIT